MPKSFKIVPKNKGFVYSLPNKFPEVNNKYPFRKTNSSNTLNWNKYKEQVEKIYEVLFLSLPFDIIIVRYFFNAIYGNNPLFYETFKNENRIFYLEVILYVLILISLIGFLTKNIILDLNKNNQIIQTLKKQKFLSKLTYLVFLIPVLELILRFITPIFKNGLFRQGFDLSYFIFIILLLFFVVFFIWNEFKKTKKSKVTYSDPRYLNYKLNCVILTAHYNLLLLFIICSRFASTAGLLIIFFGYFNLFYYIPFFLFSYGLMFEFGERLKFNNS